MPGQKKKTAEQKLRDEIRTKIWLNFLISESGATSANHLSLMMEERPGFDILSTQGGPKESGTKWSNYSRNNAPSLPGPSTIRDTDVLIAGSREVFELGPEESEIFLSLWSSINELYQLFDKNDASRDNFSWVSKLMPRSSIKCTVDEDWSFLISKFDNLFEECDSIVFNTNNINEARAKQIESNSGPLNHLALFSALYALLRVALKREEHTKNKYLMNLFDLVFKAFNATGTQMYLRANFLTEYVSKEIYQLIFNWLSEQCICSNNLNLDAIFSYENFISNPSWSIHFTMIEIENPEHAGEFLISDQSSLETKYYLGDTWANFNKTSMNLPCHYGLLTYDDKFDFCYIG